MSVGWQPAGHQEGRLPRQVGYARRVSRYATTPAAAALPQRPVQTVRVQALGVALAAEIAPGLLCLAACVVAAGAGFVVGGAPCAAMVGPLV